ncbi:alpha/beta hydrolase [Amycolatopsis jejuensis]|uniref:alpha/beta hydrolase n=1 Tax=Amycolatopsis jejuensis TaxID=330084 RepID=UPI0005272CA3|nr:alpha/beta fold hydrolase [Amycolatopsis jejuensis]
MKFFSLETADFADGLTVATGYSAALQRRTDVTLYHTGPGPLVILLHGVYGSHWAWTGNGSAHRILDRLQASGEVPPMTFAMPSDGGFGIGSGYLTRPGEDVESWVVDELPALAAEVCPSVDRSRIAIAGLSMGGWGALRLAGRHPGTFVAASGMSPLTELGQITDFAPIGDHARHTPAAEPLAEILTRKGIPPFRIACGTGDDLITPVRALHQQLSDAGVAHEYDEAPGEHDWTYWRSELAETLRFLARHVK